MPLLLVVSVIALPFVVLMLLFLELGLSLRRAASLGNCIFGGGSP
jgi:hypothetical protein